MNNSAFSALGLPAKLVNNLDLAGMDTPKPIQEAAIPAMLEGHDILGIAQTGSGKTLAFSLPILAQIISLGDKRRPKSPRALILAPTRELAVQIEDAIRTASKGAHLSTALILGGVSRLTQIKRMAPGVDVLIATPGRLMDLVREKCVDLSHTRFLVLDEADRMLDMGFIKDVERIASLVHKDRLTALFSATMPKEIEALARNLLDDPLKIEVAPQGTTAAEIEQRLFCVPTRQKKDALAGLLTDPKLESVIVFTRTKHGADGVTRFLEKTGYDVAAIHGNKSQNARQRALKDFRDSRVRVLVATDIAARGIDVPGISHVVNYDLPDEAESYVHRIGRTGRNGASGTALTLYDEALEKARLRGVERVIRKKLEREDIPQQFGALPVKKGKAAHADQDNGDTDFDGDNDDFENKKSPYRRPRRDKAQKTDAAKAKKPHRKGTRPPMARDFDGEKAPREERGFKERRSGGGRGRDEVRGGRDFSERRETRSHDDARGERGFKERRSGAGHGRDEMRGGRDFSERRETRSHDDARGERGFKERSGGRGRDEMRGGRDFSERRETRSHDDARGERGFKERRSGAGHGRDEMRGGRDFSERREARGDREFSGGKSTLRRSAKPKSTTRLEGDRPLRRKKPFGKAA